MLKPVPSIRIRSLNDRPVNGDGELVLYWMTSARRTRWNFGLQRAAERAADVKKPLVILEALRCDYPWASDRLHAFILNGMEDNRRALAGKRVLYHPYVERGTGEGKGLLAALSARAVVVVTDDFPAFFLPRMLRAAAAQSAVRLEAVDSNGLLPLRAADREFTTAHSFRRFLQKNLPSHLANFPEEDPLAAVSLEPPAPLPEEMLRRWPAASEELLRADPAALKALPLDHSVEAVETRGGSSAGEEALGDFLQAKLHVYATDRNHPDEEAVSGLSPYLHFGHVSAHGVLSALAEEEDWTPERLAEEASGSKEGWWGMGEGAEAFLDQLVTWRELGFNMCANREDYDRFESLPPWALEDLAMHAGDERPYVYTLEEFETAATHDPLWNAAQTQLLTEGRMHNYLRMLWGKKILEWSPSPREALSVMIHLNDKYALDGRDPNSSSGIFWVFGRYDRPWGPKRKIYGRIRYMSSESALRKLRVEDYLRRYAS